MLVRRIRTVVKDARLRNFSPQFAKIPEVADYVRRSRNSNLWGCTSEHGDVCAVGHELFGE
jgi:hypothetical protein